MPIINVFSEKFTNWEFVALCLIKRLIVGKSHNFSRSELISDKNIKDAIYFLSIFGHKKKPRNPQETIQRTIQDLKDKGYIKFLGGGEYILTKNGYDAISGLNNKWVDVFEGCAKNIS
jgi:hypothetical protein